jgi:hypothetical protein
VNLGGSEVRAVDIAFGLLTSTILSAEGNGISNGKICGFRGLSLFAAALPKRVLKEGEDRYVSIATILAAERPEAGWVAGVGR